MHVQEAEPLPGTEHDTKVHHVQTAEEQWYDNDTSLSMMYHYQWDQW